MPRVSVVMPAFNAERYLRPALDSVLSQDYDDFDVIVVNDGSTDSTAAILEAYAARDRRLRVMTQPNQGAAAANNLAINATDAEFIARMDADDISLPGRLSRLVGYLDEHPNAGAVGSGVAFIDHGGHQFARQIERMAHTKITHALKSGRRNPLLNPSVMFRRRCWLDAGGERVCFVRAHDFDLWIRLAAVHAIHAIPDVLLHYRIHGDNVSLKTVELQALCGLAATRSAELRRQGQPDPFDQLTTAVSTKHLLAAGCSEARCREAVLAGIAGQLVLSLMTRQIDRAEALMRLLEQMRDEHCGRVEEFFYRTSGIRIATAKGQRLDALKHALCLMRNDGGSGAELLRRITSRLANS